MQKSDEMLAQACTLEATDVEDSQATERDGQIGDFVNEVKVVLKNIESMCASLHSAELSCWAPAQRRTIEIVEKAVHDALAIIVVQAGQTTH